MNKNINTSYVQIVEKLNKIKNNNINILSFLYTYKLLKYIYSIIEKRGKFNFKNIVQFI